MQKMRGLDNSITIMTIVLLLVCSITDIKSRRLPLKLLLFFSFIFLVYQLKWGCFNLYEYIGGILIGAILMIISIISKGRIGFGDSLVFCITGLGLGFWNNLILLMYSNFTACIYAILLLILRKVKRNTTFPFIPFILISFAGIIFLGSSR